MKFLIKDTANSPGLGHGDDILVLCLGRDFSGLLCSPGASVCGGRNGGDYAPQR